MIKLSTLIPGINGKPIKNNGEDMTVRSAILLGLAAPSPRQSGSSPEETVKVWRLFRKVDTSGDEIEFNSDEIILIKKVVSERLTSEVVAGFVVDYIEPMKK